MNSMTLLKEAAAIIYKRFANHKARRFDNINLSFFEQLCLRDKPRDYIEATCQILALMQAKVIVEIGSARQPLEHGLDEFNPVCCNDGHSTFFWDRTGCEVHTVDINPNSATMINALCKNTTAYTQDGIEFLRGFDKTIDLLYLDAWDVLPGTLFAEKHLEAYQVARTKLSPRHLILIDDTDVGGAGKGELLIPVLQHDGYISMIEGRQYLFMKL